MPSHSQNTTDPIEATGGSTRWTVAVPADRVSHRGWIIHEAITATWDGQWHGRWAHRLRVEAIPAWVWVLAAVLVVACSRGMVPA